jgi:hypothetical protein
MIPVPQDNRVDRRAWALAALPLIALLASSCSAGAGQTVNAEAPPSIVPVSPLPDTAATTIASPPPTTAPTTAAPTTDAGAEPATTEPPAPTTTMAPVPTIPDRTEIVGATSQPLVAVGTSDGEATQAVQQRLLDLGFWHAGADGEYGLTTRQAVMAFQKYLGLEADGKVDEVTAAFLSNVDARARGRSDSGTLIEVDKTRQLLFIVQDGRTVWTLNTSTGDGLPYEEEDKNTPGEIQRGVSITPNGLWNVDRQREEGWWEGDLGQIYRPKYFRGGVAVHGSNSIPNYPASHGCVRVSVPAMDFIWEQDLMPMDVTVWVHGG